MQQHQGLRRLSSALSVVGHEDSAGSLRGSPGLRRRKRSSGASSVVSSVVSEATALSPGHDRTTRSAMVTNSDAGGGVASRSGLGVLGPGGKGGGGMTGVVEEEGKVVGVDKM